MHDTVFALTVVVATNRFTHFIVFLFYWILHPPIACMFIHSYLHPVSHMYSVPYCFQSPVGGSKLSWPRPCPAHFWDGRPRLAPRNCAKLASHWPSRVCSAIFWEAMPQLALGISNYAMQFSRVEVVLTETAHCAVPILSRPSWIVLCAISAVSQITGNLDCALRSSGNQSPSLSMKIAQTFLLVTQVCCMAVLKLLLVFNWQFSCHDCWSVSMYHRCSLVSQ